MEGARKSANPLPTLRQPLANPFLSNPLFPWTAGTRLETRVNGFLVKRVRRSKFALRNKITIAEYRVRTPFSRELHLPKKRSQCSKLGGVVKTLLRLSNSLSRSVFCTAGSFGQKCVCVCVCVCVCPKHFLNVGQTKRLDWTPICYLSFLRPKLGESDQKTLSFQGKLPLDR